MSLSTIRGIAADAAWLARLYMPALLISGTFAAGILGLVRVFRDDPPPPFEITEIGEQEALLDSITSLQGAGWVAGCIWDEGRDERDIVRVVKAPRGERRYWWSETPDGAAMSFVSVADAEPGESFDELSGPGYWCYVPEEGG